MSFYDVHGQTDVEWQSKNFVSPFISKEVKIPEPAAKLYIGTSPIWALLSGTELKHLHQNKKSIKCLKLNHRIYSGKSIMASEQAKKVLQAVISSKTLWKQPLLWNHNQATIICPVHCRLRIAGIAATPDIWFNQHNRVKEIFKCWWSFGHACSKVFQQCCWVHYGLNRERWSIFLIMRLGYLGFDLQDIILMS